MKDKETKVRVNTRLPQSVIDRWHLFALQHKKTKEDGLEEIIKRGTKK